MMTTLAKFLPALVAFIVALINAIAPEISKFVAEHPDIAVNGYALLTTIANAINPGRVKSIEANS
jgi:hypothetical protein